MKRTRKAFLAAAAVVGASMTVPHEVALAQSAPPPAAPPPAATPPAATPPAATPTPVPKAPSAAARALAERMRAFDPQLDATQIDRIAAGIQENLEFGATLDPKGAKLKNGDAPTPEFAVRP